MRHFIFAIIVLWSSMLTAQTYPALHDVKDVAADDVLNIRSDASPNSDIIGALAPDQTGVEVVELSIDGKWGRVNTNEQSGWASLRYLQPVGHPDWFSGEVPLYCYGTEPFWSLSIDPANGTSEFERMGEPPEAPLIFQVMRSIEGYPPVMEVMFDHIVLNGADMNSTVCSDGMSDRLYGIETTLHSVSDNPLTAPSLVRGCCSISP